MRSLRVERESQAKAMEISAAQKSMAEKWLRCTSGRLLGDGCVRRKTDYIKIETNPGLQGGGLNLRGKAKRRGPPQSKAGCARRKADSRFLVARSSHASPNDNLQ
jgi:hypothetical protein